MPPHNFSTGWTPTPILGGRLSLLYSAVSLTGSAPNTACIKKCIKAILAKIGSRVRISLLRGVLESEFWARIFNHTH